MLGYSKDIKTQIVYGENKLKKWLNDNDVKVLDIKFSYDSNYGTPETFLIIYTA